MKTSKFVTDAPTLAILAPDASRTLSISGSTATIGATCIRAQKGSPSEPLLLSKANMLEMVGKPFHVSIGTDHEGVRQLNDALNECQYVVAMRVLAADARYPVLTFDDAGAVTASNEAYTTDVAVAGSDVFAIYPKDGDPSTDRRVSITALDTTNETFTIYFESKVNGEWVALETREASLDIDSVDDLGIPNHIEAVFEGSSRFSVMVNPLKAFADVAVVAVTAFSGGTNGGDPTTADYIAAWEVLRDENHAFDVGFLAGQYDPTVIANAIDICETKLAQVRFDAPPTMTQTAARDWLVALNLDSFQAQCYHYPFSAYDQWYGTRSVWGLSGGATASKAKCNATVTGHVAVKGAHFGAAGRTRGIIERSNIKPIHTTGQLPEEDLVAARLNFTEKGRYIADVMTTSTKRNYLRFEHVAAVHNAMIRDLVEAAGVAQYEPDGITEELLNRLGTEICDKYVRSKALVEPRDPTLDGTSPYILTITQEEFDLWKIELAICVTGIFRRGAIQPVLIK